MRALGLEYLRSCFLYNIGNENLTLKIIGGNFELLEILVQYIIKKIWLLRIIYLYRKPEANWGSSTQAQQFVTTLKNCHTLNEMPEHVKNYRLVVFCDRLCPVDAAIRDIHISKQFKWNLYLYVSGQSRPFWAVVKLL